MSTYHYHIGRCPHCSEEATRIGCQLDNCGFPTTWAEMPTSWDDGMYEETCQHCGEVFWVDYGNRPRDYLDE